MEKQHLWLSVNGYCRLIGAAMLFVFTMTQAEDGLQPVQKGGVQVKAVTKTNPLGGSHVEYMRVLVEGGETGTALPKHGSPLSELNARVDVETPQNAELNKGFIVNPENVTGKEATLLAKIKAEKLAKQGALNKKELSLLPSELLIKPKKVTKVARKKPRAKEDILIGKLEFNQASIMDVSRALADISGLNFVATEEAAKKRVTVFLQNISVKNALEAITKNSGLWYRRDKISGTYRIMSTEEYQRDLVVYREDITRVFNLLHPNPVIVARAVSDLYGDRVILSYGSDYDDFNTGEFNGGGNSSGRSGLSGGQSNLRKTVTKGNSSRNNQTLRSSNNKNNKSTDEKVTGTSANGAIIEKFTADQLARLEAAVNVDEDGNLIDADAIRGISRAQQPIYITVSRQQNMMIVRTSDSVVVDEIKHLVKSMDKPTSQVLLEMKILEIDVGDAYNQLFSFGAISKNGKHRAFGVENDDFSDTGKFIYQFVDDLIGVKLELLESTNKAKIISSPLLLASNNRTARLFVGEERLLIRGATLTDAVLNQNGFISSPAKITYETELRNVGNTLNITPKINADGTVTLGIFQDSSTVNKGAIDFPPLVSNGTVINIKLDTIQTSNIEGVVVAKDGLTVAIGGLISTSVSKREDKVPILGDLPIIGNAFKDIIESSSRKEMVLLITPHIITTPSESDDISRDVIEPLTDQQW